MSVLDLNPVKELDFRGYLDRLDMVDGCLAGYGKALGKTVEWREETRAAADLLRSEWDSGQDEDSSFDFAVEVGVIEQDERDIETLFYRYAYAQVHRTPPGLSGIMLIILRKGLIIINKK